MEKIIARKNENFTIVDNEILKDRTISLKAKAIHITVMSLPETWDFSIAGIAVLVKEGRDAVSSAMKELREAGYCEYKKERNTKGHFVHSYIFYQSKTLKEATTPKLESPAMESPAMEVPKMEKPTQIKYINNKVLKNKELNNKTPLYPPEGEKSVVGELVLLNKQSSQIEKPVYSPQFEEFWILYGRKGKKVEAEKAFAKAMSKIDFSSLLVAVKQYLSSHEATKDGGRYKMHAASYLNGQCWESNWQSGKVSFSNPDELREVWDTLPLERKKNIEAVAWLNS